MQLPKDFKEFIELMIVGNVRFVMIGGYAYNLYRNPRATGDIDFFVDVDTENQSRLRTAFVAFGFGFGAVLPDQDQKIIETGKVLMLGRSPFRIALLTEIDGVNFEEVESSCEQFEIDGLTIPVISVEMLLKNKEAAGGERKILQMQKS